MNAVGTQMFVVNVLVSLATTRCDAVSKEAQSWDNKTLPDCWQVCEKQVDKRSRLSKDDYTHTRAQSQQSHKLIHLLTKKARDTNSLTTSRNIACEHRPIPWAPWHSSEDHLQRNLQPWLAATQSVSNRQHGILPRSTLMETGTRCQPVR